MDAQAESSGTSASTSDKEDDFFSSLKRKPSKGIAEIENYMSMNSRQLSVLDSFPSLRKLSVMLNMPLPASAACKRLFSTAGLIFTLKRANLDATKFENQLLLKLNAQYCKKK